MKFVSKFFVILLIFCGTFENTKSNFCEYAPECPDLVTWKIGYVCDDNLMPQIKTRVIDGIVKKTICCKVPKQCKQNFWCNSSLTSEETTEKPLEKPSNVISKPSCNLNCASHWKPLEPNNSPIIDGVRVGSFAPGISSFVGRISINNEVQIGRIQLVPPIGLFYSFDGVGKFQNSSIEYLTRNPNYTWKNSSNGERVEDAVTMAGSRNSPFYIGRVKINGFEHVGTVVRSLGLLYYSDGSGVERTTDCYEVLACQSTVISVKTTARPPTVSSTSSYFVVTSIHNLVTNSNLNVNIMPESSISSNLVSLQKPQNETPSNLDLNNLVEEDSTLETVINQTTTSSLNEINFADSVNFNVTNEEIDKTEIVEKPDEINFDTLTNEATTETVILNVDEETSQVQTQTTTLQQSTTKRTKRTTTTKKFNPSLTTTTTIKETIDTNKNQTHESTFPIWIFTTESTTADASLNSSEVFQVNDESEEDKDKVDEYPCASKWKIFPENSSFLYDGVEINGQKSDMFSYIGRMNEGKFIIPGRIDIKTSTSVISFNRNQMNSTKIEYLAKSHNQNYSWIKSSNGQAVKSAVSITEINEWPFLIGKSKINGKFYVGKVLPSIGLKFIDRYGNEKYTKFYEVLVCNSMIHEMINDDLCNQNRKNL
ncbi:hypothetical protein PVAND_015754 [Polypedilum vanderplanki]|uniref:Uncharacterized protein n=1 Tax=Polypedilum vanderplanki TaxID=319348 RepID=A0A9J6BDW3_POLVA|nr:hypothetical protein PVAND_015754 [Polypedilum vanderplanki]